MQKNIKFSKICLIYFISLFLFVALRIASSFGAFNALNEYLGDAIFTLITQLIFMFALPLTLYILFYKKEKFNKQSLKQTLIDFGFKKVSTKTVVIAVLLGVCVYVFNMVIASFFDAIITGIGYSGVSTGGGTGNGELWYLFFTLTFTAVLPGIFEEFMHRGILLKGLNETKNYKWAIIFSGLFFGFMHLNINQFFYATIIGCFFAFIAIISKNIWVPIIMHFMNNAINVYLSWASNSGSFGSKFYSNLNNFLQNGNIVIVTVCSICFMIVISLLTIFLTILLYNENNKDKKIFARLFTTKHIKNFVSLNKNNISQENVSLNYNSYISQDNNFVPTQENAESLFELKEEQVEKFDYRYHIFFFAIILLGVLVTVSTLIWGLL